MRGLALYRGSNSDHIEQICGEVVEYCQECTDGFVVAGFEGDKWFIKNEATTGRDAACRVFNYKNNNRCETLQDGASSVSPYHTPFSKFHKSLTDGHFDKLVLSRRKFLPGKIDILKSFHTACSLYPDQNIILFSTPQTGTWLVVTPELLVEMNGEKGTTMALAGTKKGNIPWTDKERREQSLVADYIEDRLKTVSDNVIRHETEDAQAGDLTHIRTRFDFTTDKGWSEVAHRLHPTPAVCGLPVDEAKKFIVDNEGYDRRFYSGYCGVVNPHNCRLLVTLRCAEICSDGCWLYAGGGLLAESDEESEFIETENKMQTIIKCIVINHR